MEIIIANRIVYKIFKKKPPAGLLNDPFYKLSKQRSLREYVMIPFTKYLKRKGPCGKAYPLQNI